MKLLKFTFFLPIVWELLIAPLKDFKKIDFIGHSAKH